MPGGRPSKYTPKLADEICERLAAGDGLIKVCRAEDMPDRVTVLRWLDKHDEFRIKYADARDKQYNYWSEQVLEISDDGTNDTYRNDDGSLKVQHDHIQRSRLRVDTRKWLLSKLLPKQYGEFQRTELSGPNGDPVQVNVNIRLRKLPDAE